MNNRFNATVNGEALPEQITAMLSTVFTGYILQDGKETKLQGKKRGNVVIKLQESKPFIAWLASLDDDISLTVDMREDDDDDTKNKVFHVAPKNLLAYAKNWVSIENIKEANKTLVRVERVGDWSRVGRQSAVIDVDAMINTGLEALNS